MISGVIVPLRWSSAMMNKMFGMGPGVAIAPEPRPGRAASVTAPARTQNAIVVVRTRRPGLGSQGSFGLRAAELLVNSRPLLAPNIFPRPATMVGGVLAYSG